MFNLFNNIPAATAAVSPAITVADIRDLRDNFPENIIPEMIPAINPPVTYQKITAPPSNPADELKVSLPRYPPKADRLMLRKIVKKVLNKNPAFSFIECPLISGINFCIFHPAFRAFPQPLYPIAERLFQEILFCFLSTYSYQVQYTSELFLLWKYQESPPEV